MSIKIGKNDKRIFTRIVKGSKVQNDVSLAAAKRLVHMGWSIEDDRFEPNGFPRQSHIEQDIHIYHYDILHNKFNLGSPNARFSL